MWESGKGYEKFGTKVNFMLRRKYVYARAQLNHDYSGQIFSFV